MKTIFTSLVALPMLLLCSSFPSYAQSVKVRIISAKDAKPLKDQPIIVSLLYDNTQKRPPDLETTIRINSDANGEASFALPQPAPAHLGAQVRLTSDNWRCACLTLATSQDVLGKGITVTAAGQKSPGSLPAVAHPAEILFFARPLTFFERLLEPLVKQ